MFDRPEDRYDIEDRPFGAIGDPELPHAGHGRLRKILLRVCPQQNCRSVAGFLWAAALVRASLSRMNNSINGIRERR